MNELFIPPPMPRILKRQVARRIKEVNVYMLIYRSRMRLTKIDLARLVGVDPKTIYNVENGKVLPNVALAIKIAKVLGVTVEDIFKFIK